jgi:N-acetylmuramoyl-L-alanine amidase
VKILVIPGHTSENPGAKAYNGQTEFAFNTQVVQNLAYISSSVLSNFQLYQQFNHHMSYDEMFSRIYTNRPELHFDLCLLLHFNSFTSQVQGCEIHHLTGGGAQEGPMAGNLAQAFRYQYDVDLRGEAGVVRASTPESRAWTQLTAAHMVSENVLLLEPFFGHIKDGVSEKFIEYPKLYASFLHNWLENVRGLFSGRGTLGAPENCS